MKPPARLPIPPLAVPVAAAGILAAGLLLWPPMEADTVRAGLLPAGARPAVMAPDEAAPEPSSAARQIAFAAPGPSADQATVGVEAPLPPPPDADPLLVGVAGSGKALVGYFSSNGRTWRAVQGEVIDGWKLVSLAPREARLVKGRRRLTAGLFAARSGPLSPMMAAPERRAYVAPTTASAPAATGASKAPAKRRPPPPPPPKGSKGYWTGPPGSMPPGFTPMPKPTD